MGSPKREVPIRPNTIWNREPIHILAQQSLMVWVLSSLSMKVWDEGMLTIINA